MDENNQPKTVISDKTLVPIGFVLILITGVIRVETTSFRANANENEIRTIKSESRLISEELKKHGETLARIEALLEERKQDKRP